MHVRTGDIMECACQPTAQRHAYGPEQIGCAHSPANLSAWKPMSDHQGVVGHDSGKADAEHECGKVETDFAGNESEGQQHDRLGTRSDQH